MELTVDQRRAWFADGVLVLERFFDDDVLDAVERVHDRVWTERPDHLVVDDLRTGARRPISDVAVDEPKAFKLNDLYLDHEEIRALGLHRQLVSVLEGLMVDRPVLINSLSLEYGTQQAMHQDSLFMTPLSPFNLAAAWVALEDVHPGAGPLEYYPGSHLLPVHRFSNGTSHAVESELADWHEHLASGLREFGLEKTTFLPRRGDVLLWHAYLAHGGGAVDDDTTTRKSIVFHYFPESDCRVRAFPLGEHGGGYWYARPHISANDDRAEGARSVIGSRQFRRWTRAAEQVRSRIRNVDR